MTSPGVELRVLAALRGVSQRQVARRANLSEATLSRILNERQPVSAEAAMRVRKAIFADE